MRLHGIAGLSSAFGFVLVVLFVLVTPSFAAAQHSMGSYRAAPSAPVNVQVTARVSHAAPASARVYSPGHAGGTHTARVASSATGSNSGANHFGAFGWGEDPLPVQQILNPYPGFGFDFEHLTAIHRDDDIKALIDPATQVRLANAERRFRKSPRSSGGFIFLIGGGAYALPDDASADGNADQDAQVAADQQGQAQSAESPHDASERPIIIIQQAGEPQPSAESNEAAAREEEAEPLPDEGEFTLVLRNGREIEAVAFTHSADKIIYITTTGGRRTLALSEIDSDATVRMNQERGTPLQLPL